MPPVMAYFPDDNAFDPEGEWFWVKGKSRADVILRAPVADLGNDRFVTKVDHGADDRDPERRETRSRDRLDRP